MKFYRDNRIVPPIIAFVTLCLIWQLVDISPQQPANRKTEAALAPTAPAPAADHEKATSHDTEDSTKISEADRGAGTPSKLSSDDVLFILKTGATVLWKRLPIHLTTSLSPDRINPKNTIIYSDVDAKIGNHSVIDILNQLPQSAKDSPNFELLTAIRDWESTNFYLERTGLPGDDDGPPGGWKLDKYKFLPLVQDAGLKWPDAKWYLYTEDDTYMFLPNVLHYLSAYNHREPHFLGGLAEKLGTTFAHGGSGFALSRAAWEQSFGKGGDLTKKYHDFVDDACCGDYALGKVLNDFGVKFGENNGDEGWSWGFNGLPHYKIEFSKANWCLPVLTWHHAHNRDIARYHELEASWDFSKRPLYYGDFYTSIIAPSITKRKRWWDNFSGRYGVHSSSAASSPRPDDAFDEALWSAAWKSTDSCEAACHGWSSCVQWYYYGDDCKMDDRFFMGHGYPDGMRYRKDKLESVSGWLPERINTWKCT